MARADLQPARRNNPDSGPRIDLRVRGDGRGPVGVLSRPASSVRRNEAMDGEYSFGNDVEPVAVVRDESANLPPTNPLRQGNEGKALARRIRSKIVGDQMAIPA